MEEGNKKAKIRSFTDLRVWQEAHKLALMVYEITRSFPKEEMFGLTSQMRRAVVSISSNIAEGFSRQYYSEKTQFYTTAQGSNTELQNQLLLARDINYLAKKEFSPAAVQSMYVQKILNGLIKKSKSIRDA